VRSGILWETKSSNLRDDMRILRHDLDYDYRPGMIFEHELEDMKKKVKMLEKEVLRWLKKNHPELI